MTLLHALHASDVRVRSEARHFETATKTTVSDTFLGQSRITTDSTSHWHPDTLIAILPVGNAVCEAQFDCRPFDPLRIIQVINAAKLSIAT